MRKKYSQTVATLILYLLNILIIAYTMLYIIGPLNEWHFYTDQFRYAEYDAVVRSCAKSYLEEVLMKETEVKAYLVTGAGFGDVVKSNTASVSLEIIQTIEGNSLAGIKGILIPDVLMKTYDAALAKRQDAILLAASYAAKLSVSLGDTVYLKDKPYILAGTYINDMWLDAFVLSEETNPFYDKVYLKFNDPTTGIEFIKNHYFDQLDLFLKYGEDFLQLATPEEIASQRDPVYHFREVDVRKNEGDYQHNRTEATAHIIIGLGLVLILQIYSNHRRFEKKIKFHAVRISCGYRKIRLLFHHFLYGLLQELLAFFPGIWLYTKFFGSIRTLTFQELYPLFIVMFLMGAVILAIFSQYELRNSKLLQVLRTEE